MALCVRHSPYSICLQSLTGGGSALSPIDEKYISSAKKISDLVRTASFKKILSEAFPLDQKSVQLELTVYENKVTATLHGRPLVEISIDDESPADELSATAREVSELAQTLFPNKVAAEVEKPKAVKVEEDNDEFFDSSSDLASVDKTQTSANPTSVTPTQTKAAPVMASPVITTQPSAPDTKKPSESNPAKATSKATSPTSVVPAKPASLSRPVGITNTGNTCFAASATQLFRHVPSLRRLIEQRLPNAPLKNALLTATSGKVLVEAVNPLITVAGNQFSPGTAYDANEFYGYLLENLPKDTAAWTPVETNTQFTNSNTKKDAHSVKTEYHCGLNLPLITQKGKQITTFNEALSLSLNEEADPAYDSSTATHRLTKSPEQLFVKLQRKGHLRNVGVVKYEQALQDIPYILDLGKHNAFTPGVQSNPMELKGVIVHTGSADDKEPAHYISYFQTEDGTWYCANDSRVEPTSLDKVLKAAKHATDLYYDTTLSEAGRKALEKADDPASNCVIS